MSQIITYRLLMLAYITAQRQLIHEKTASRSECNTKYDFIVVGAGSAGSAVAMRLSEDKTINVLLLEAGGPQNAVYNDIPGMVWYKDMPEINSWKYYNEPQIIGKQYPSGRIPEFKGMTLGGSSAHNGMAFNRGNRRDFDNWVKSYGAKGWSYAEVLPYFKKFENNTDLRIVRQNTGYHGTSGPVQISTSPNPPEIIILLQKTYNEIGFKNIDINGAKQSGAAILQLYITSNGFRSGTGNAYVDPNPHPENLHIVCKALVVKILFKGLTAIGVEFIKNSKSYKVFADKEVVISAGPINSPQLFMLSGIGEKNHLEHLNIPVKLDLPVGNNYHNHVWIPLPINVTKDVQVNLPDLTVNQLSQLYYNSSGPLSDLPLNFLYFSTKNNSNTDWPNAIISSGYLKGSLLLSFQLYKVRSRGTIRLQSSNPLVPPLIDPKFLTEKQDYEDIIDGIRYALYVLETTSISKYIDIIPESIDCPVCANKHIYQCTDTIKCIIRKNTGSGVHPGGSCRMGAIERSDVVVDPYLRVKNVRNLRVCDSSIFPELPNANTNAASIMVGEKCAQIIKDFYHFE